MHARYCMQYLGRILTIIIFFTSSKHCIVNDSCIINGYC